MEDIPRQVPYTPEEREEARQECLKVIEREDTKTLHIRRKVTTPTQL